MTKSRHRPAGGLPCFYCIVRQIITSNGVAWIQGHAMLRLQRILAAIHAIACAHPAASPAAAQPPALAHAQEELAAAGELLRAVMRVYQEGAQIAPASQIERPAQAVAAHDLGIGELRRLPPLAQSADREQAGEEDTDMECAQNGDLAGQGLGATEHAPDAEADRSAVPGSEGVGGRRTHGLNGDTAMPAAQDDDDDEEVGKALGIGRGVLPYVYHMCMPLIRPAGALMCHPVLRVDLQSPPAAADSVGMLGPCRR